MEEIWREPKGLSGLLGKQDSVESRSPGLRQLMSNSYSIYVVAGTSLL